MLCCQLSRMAFTHFLSSNLLLYQNGGGGQPILTMPRFWNSLFFYTLEYVYPPCPKTSLTSVIWENLLTVCHWDVNLWWPILGRNQTKTEKGKKDVRQRSGVLSVSAFSSHYLSLIFLDLAQAMIDNESYWGVIIGTPVSIQCSWNYFTWKILKEVLKRT